MKEIKEFLKTLNQDSTVQEYSMEDEISEICGLEDVKIIKMDLYPDKHRHYELATAILSLYGYVFGVIYISQIYSEEGDFKSIYHTYDFFEVEEIKTTTYKRKHEKN